MTIAFDAFSSYLLGGVNPSWTHTPVGTPKGVIVWILQGSATDEVTGVTYGGVAMTEVAGSPNMKATGEVIGCYCYFLGSGIPTGARTVQVSGGVSVAKAAYCVTVTAAGDTMLQDVDATINSDSVANPSVTMSLGGLSSFVALAFDSGQNAATGVTPFTGWTGRNETSSGVQTIGCYTYDTVGTADVTAGWTQTAEDAVAIVVAIKEKDLPIDLSSAPATSAAAGADPSLVLGSIAIDLVGTPAAVISEGIDPMAILGALQVDGGIAPAAGVAIDPAAVLGLILLDLASLPAESPAGAIDPSVPGSGVSVDLSGDPAQAISLAIDPLTVLGNVIVILGGSESPAGAGDPVVVFGAVAVDGGVAAVAVLGVDPAVELGYIAVLAPEVAAQATAVDPGVIGGTMLILTRMILEALPRLRTLKSLGRTRTITGARRVRVIRTRKGE